MTTKKDFMPMVYEFKDVQMDEVDNTNLFNSYIKTTQFIFLTLKIEATGKLAHPLLKEYLIKKK